MYFIETFEFECYITFGLSQQFSWYFMGEENEENQKCSLNTHDLKSCQGKIWKDRERSVIILKIPK